MALLSSNALASAVSLFGPDSIMLLFIIFGFGFPIWMIVDCINRESDENNNRLIWLLVIILAPLGSFIYLFARKLRRPSLRRQLFPNDRNA